MFHVKPRSDHLTRRAFLRSSVAVVAVAAVPFYGWPPGGMITALDIENAKEWLKAQDDLRNFGTGAYMHRNDGSVRHVPLSEIPA